MRNKPMIVAGVMSGTSADGINVALVRIQRKEKKDSLRTELLGQAEYPYPPKVRAAVLAAMNANSVSVADLSRLNFLLGELYASAVLKTQTHFKVKADLVGCHGQTIYHQGNARPYLGYKVAATWQTGEGAIIAARTGVPTVSDFRPADLAAGGKGAPLVPYLDYLLFRDARKGRIVQNIGGIANLTAIPAGAKPRDVVAFDTGPGNMVLDAITEKLYGQPFDRGGKIAATGKVLDEVVAKFLRGPFFAAKPPKTAGREEFGREFVREFLQACGRTRKQDVLATATALTAKSIADAVKRLTASSNAKARPAFAEMILSGGGAKNSTLVAALRDDLSPIGITLRLSDDLGLPAEAKEAVAFAVLAHETWHHRPSNIPSATGAEHPAILGKISFP